MSFYRALGRALAGLSLSCLALPGLAQPSLAPSFAADYAIRNLGAPSGVTGNLGGLTLLAGQADTLLIGGNANSALGAIFSIGLVRDADQHIVGFSGPATRFASAPEIDGGLAYGPGGVLFYTGFNENLLGQIRPGSTAPDRVIELSPLGVQSSVGGLGFVPPGAPGAGALQLASFNSGRFYSATLSPDGAGTFDLLDLSWDATLPGGPEGLVHVPTGSPGFDAPTMLVSEWSAGRVGAYELDAAGVPIVASRRDFISGLVGAEGGFIDPLSGDFLFSTFAGSQSGVIVVGGFAAPVPEPSAAALLLAGLALMVACGARSNILRYFFPPRPQRCSGT